MATLFIFCLLCLGQLKICFHVAWHIILKFHYDVYFMQGRVLREFSPEEVTSNIYTMVDVLLHNIQVELQHGLPIQV